MGLVPGRLEVRKTALKSVTGVSVAMGVCLYLNSASTPKRWSVIRARAITGIVARGFEGIGRNFID